MPELHTDTLYARVSAVVSSEDGVQHAVLRTVGTSAFLTNMADMLTKLFNRITTPSCTLQVGGSGAAVQLGFPLSAGGTVGIEGLFHGVPFAISAAGTISGDPADFIGSSNMDTNSAQIRKVAVGLSLGDISAVTSSIASNVGTLTFKTGSVYGVSVALAASTGGVSSWFNQVPTPKLSGGLILVGVINVPNSFTASDALTAAELTFPLREIYGVDLSAVWGSAVQQP